MLLTGAMFYGFISGRARVEIISLLTISAIALGLYSFPLPGRAPTEGLKLAFEGFGHYALVTICALMVLGRGLVTTGALEPVSRLLTRVWRFNQQIGLLVTLVLALGMSMMVNDTPVLVLMLPIMAAIAANGGMPASRTLIPINSAVLIGGMSTTIGTSTNLLVVSIAGDMGLPAMTVFHFTPIVMMAAVVALPFIWLVMPRLLPDNSVVAGHAPRQFTALLRLGGSSVAWDVPRSRLDALLPTGVEILSEPGGDGRMLVRATHVALEETMRVLGATAAPAWLMERLRGGYARTGEDLTVVELSIPKDSGLIGRGVASANVAERYNTAILGVHRAHRSWLAEPSTDVISETAFDEGDILLVTGTRANIRKMSLAENVLILDGAKEMPRTAKATLALAIMACAVIPASMGIVPIAISALGGAIAMLVTGCVRFDRIGRALSAKVIVLVAASIAIGRVVLETGAATWLSELLALGLQFLPPAGVLAAVMLFVTLLTNFASNTTAAAVGTPIAFSLGQQLNIPVEPLVLAVLFGCNLCYATPVAYQTNMLIMSAGDYKFGDYTRTGLPLVGLMIVTLSALLVYRYGLY
ncbi:MULTISPECIES: SLC13 family permease [unclassified Sphingobium]|uniref:SLC13 family permease n=1 Tax=unclassified Sphingobium TaxID=2611147 RepID=UPI00119B7CB4|nr:MULTISPECIES: SLC13 family permease [unclassified Sphingobium]MBG6119878.1 di/tricarboxylate transporter [Sphingobium sp. JAI105]TWC98978.1 TrkA family protein [Sphingobium sp. AEW010]TWD18463.1 TrkA family protein [Sphingobium sp. AEW013]TWD21265.1 TrkA family protein [Sphingobium sp. AEW001]